MFSQTKVSLLPRNEGKIKSYESCFDIRAWSHDTDTRVRYLRDWIKSDIPVCIIPVSTVTRSLRMMTWRRRGKITPRCHPDCKSKVILDSICNSCHVIKECFKGDEKFKKYFEEEEFATTHWPCERCLEALKSIKMFWMIILERVFKIKFPRSNESKGSTETVKSIARIWQQEVVEQALFVKSLTPFINEQLSLHSLTPPSKHRSNETLPLNMNKKDASTDTTFIYNYDISKHDSVTFCNKLSRCTSIKNNTNDVGCGAVEIKNYEGNAKHKANLDYLQQQFNKQSTELRHLKREHMSLKLELRNMRKSVVSPYTPVLISDKNILVPKPFETYIEEMDGETVKDIESEIIITMTNCENKNYRHVSMLQVLHKTNDIIAEDKLIVNNQQKNNEDPVEVLTKVHDIFGALVKREHTIASKKKSNRKNVNINAYHRLPTYKYDRKVPAQSTHSSISDAIYISTTDIL